MSVYSAQVTVGTSPARLDLARGWNGAAGGACLIRNRGSVAIYLGNSNVTTSTGFQIDPGDSISIDLRSADPVYAISGSAGQACHVFQADGAA
jgi:ApbE superfamily uncharacterized protein (UPF0280 family)